MSFPLHPAYGGKKPAKPPFRKGQRVRDLHSGAEGRVCGKPWCQEQFAPIGQNDQDGGTFLHVDWIVPVDWDGLVAPLAATRLGPLE